MPANWAANQHKEECNCEIVDARYYDVHINLVALADQDATQSAIVEVKGEDDQG